MLKLQRPDIRARGRTSSACAAAKELHQQTANSISGRKSGPSPGNPASTTERTRSLATSARTSGRDPDIRLVPKPRTSGPLRPEIRPLHHRMHLEDPGQPGHPAPLEAPDIRPVARTSGHPCLRIVRAEARVPLRPPRLYILFLLHLSRVSIGLAHM